MEILWFRLSATSKGELEKGSFKNIDAALSRNADFQREECLVAAFRQGR